MRVEIMKEVIPRRTFPAGTRKPGTTLSTLQRFSFRILSSNGEEISTSKAYVNRADCMDTAALIVGDRAKIVDLTDE